MTTGRINQVNRYMYFEGKKKKRAGEPATRWAENVKRAMHQSHRRRGGTSLGFFFFFLLYQVAGKRQGCAYIARQSTCAVARGTSAQAFPPCCRCVFFPYKNDGSWGGPAEAVVLENPRVTPRRVS